MKNMKFEILDILKDIRARHNSSNREWNPDSWHTSLYDWRRCVKKWSWMNRKGRKIRQAECPAGGEVEILWPAPARDCFSIVINSSLLGWNLRHAGSKQRWRILIYASLAPCRTTRLGGKTHTRCRHLTRHQVHAAGWSLRASGKSSGLMNVLVVTLTTNLTELWKRD